MQKFRTDAGTDPKIPDKQEACDLAEKAYGNGEITMLRKFIPMLIVILAAGGLFFCLHEKEELQIRTETEPIYHHFPDLPKTGDVEWCSTSSGGIGLVTTHLYLYCWYDHDIREELLAMGIGQDLDIEQTLDGFSFIPGRLTQQPQTWKKVGSDVFAFQTGVKDSDKMNTEVYLNADGTILYLEAVGD